MPNAASCPVPKSFSGCGCISGCSWLSPPQRVSIPVTAWPNLVVPAKLAQRALQSVRADARVHNVRSPPTHTCLIHAKPCADLGPEVRRDNIRLVDQFPEHVHRAWLLEVEHDAAFAVVGAEVKIATRARVRIGDLHDVGTVLGEDAAGGWPSQDLREIDGTNALQRMRQCMVFRARRIRIVPVGAVAHRSAQMGDITPHRINRLNRDSASRTLRFGVAAPVRSYVVASPCVGHTVSIGAVQLLRVGTRRSLRLRITCTART